MEVMGHRQKLSPGMTGGRQSQVESVRRGGEGIVNVADFVVSVEDRRWDGGGEGAIYSCRVLHMAGQTIYH